MEQMYTKKEIFKQMFKIGIPVAAQNFVSVLVNMLDTIMIGSVGEAQLGAINQVNSLYLFFNMFVWGISMGTVVITARYWGQQKIDPIRDMIGLAMKINVIAGLLLSAVTDASFLDILYETASATATVGLTRNLTGSLNTIGKIIIIANMYFGRVGPISLAVALNLKKQNPNIIKNPVEDISVG